MNILIMYPRMFHPHHGGIERVSHLLCLEFQKRGHCVCYLHNVKETEFLDYPYPAPVHFFPDSSPRECEKNGPYYRDLLEKEHIDIVINQEIYAYHKLLSYSKDLEQVHVISVLHNNPLYIYNTLGTYTVWFKEDTFLGKFKIARLVKVPWRKRKLLRELRTCYEDTFSYADLVCLLSKKFIPEMTRIRPRNINFKQMIVIANPNTYPEQSLVFAKKRQILYVGRLTWYVKRVDRLAEIWKLLYKNNPDWELVIIGDGPERKELQEMFRGTDRVVFKGWQEPEHYYKESSILCLPSDTEGWGMVLTEAMTFGVVPVAFNSFAAVDDIIEDGKTGLLVKPFSVKMFAQKVQILIDDQELRLKMAVDCKKSVKRFSVDRIAKEWEEVFLRLKADK